MTKFLKYVAVILIIVFGFMLLLDVCYTYVFNNSTPRNKLQYILKANNKTYDAVFLGNSRVENHVDIECFDSISNLKSINLGEGGASINYNFLQLKLLAKNNTIKHVYIQLDANYEVEDPKKIKFPQALPFVNNSIIKTHVKKYSNNAFSILNIPFYRYAYYGPKIGFREMTMALLNKKPNIDFSNGFEASIGQPKPLLPYTLPDKIAQQNKSLEGIIRFCKQNEINLILYTSPFCSLTTNHNYITALNKKYPNLVDLTKGYNNDLFYNCNHLNAKGAKQFTLNLYKATKHQLK